MPTGDDTISFPNSSSCHSVPPWLQNHMDCLCSLWHRVGLLRILSAGIMVLLFRPYENVFFKVKYLTLLTLQSIQHPLSQLYFTAYLGFRYYYHCILWETQLQYSLDYFGATIETESDHSNHLQTHYPITFYPQTLGRMPRRLQGQNVWLPILQDRMTD